MVPERNPVEEPDQLYKEFIVITGLNLLVNMVFHTLHPLSSPATIDF